MISVGVCKKVQMFRCSQLPPSSKQRGEVLKYVFKNGEPKTGAGEQLNADVAARIECRWCVHLSVLCLNRHKENQFLHMRPCDRCRAVTLPDKSRCVVWNTRSCLAISKLLSACIVQYHTVIISLERPFMVSSQSLNSSKNPRFYGQSGRSAGGGVGVLIPVPKESNRPSILGQVKTNVHSNKIFI